MTASIQAHAETARAETSGDKAALLAARRAWDEGDFEKAEASFKQAIESGGLAPNELVEAHVFLGSARGVLGNKDGASAAFRSAATIDPNFEVPPEAGKKVVQMAAQAKKEAAKQGVVLLRSNVPATNGSGAPIKVAIQVDEHIVPLITNVGIHARDALSRKQFSQTVPAAPKVAFEVPASVSIAGTRVTVRVDALDGHNNRLFSVEDHVDIGEAQATTVTSVPKERSDKKGGGFWSSPWPYVVGGVLLAAGGGSVYLLTRTPDTVSAGAPTVRAR